MDLLLDTICFIVSHCLVMDGDGSGIIGSLLFIIPFIFSELLIIPYSVLLDIHYSVSSLSSNSLFRMPKP